MHFQPKSSIPIGAKLEISPQGLKKGYYRIREANLQPLDVNVLAFISNLGAKQQAKNAQSWPQVFSALTPSVKWGLNIRSL
jgi:hypothetical protein